MGLSSYAGLFLQLLVIGTKSLLLAADLQNDVTELKKQVNTHEYLLIGVAAVVALLLVLNVGVCTFVVCRFCVQRGRRRKTTGNAPKLNGCDPEKVPPKATNTATRDKPKPRPVGHKRTAKQPMAPDENTDSLAPPKMMASQYLDSGSTRTKSEYESQSTMASEQYSTDSEM